MTPEELAPSYRALLAVPSIGRILLAMQLARIAASMVNIAIVLFTLATFDSPALAGLVTFASIFPGLVASPVAGALLDRHGRVRLIALDYVVAAGSMVLIGVLALAGALPPWLLVCIAAVSSLTGMLSHTGLRSLFPLVAPEGLWERVNAVDSNGYVIATIVGPPLAAGMVAIVGAPETLIGIALVFGLAVIPLIGLPEPVTESATSGGLLLDARDGIRYFWRNRTLRALGFAMSCINLAMGMTTVLVPVLVVRVLGAGELAVGIVFALSGLAGMGSVFAAGRLDTRGREWRMIVVPSFLSAPAVALLLPVTGVGNLQVGLAGGLALMAGWAIAVGLLQGPLDIAIFTVRQRRTDPAWLGRAFAVSMAVNFAGFPIGAALAGSIATISLAGAVGLGIVACLVGGAIAAVLLPRAGEDVVPGVDLVSA